MSRHRDLRPGPVPGRTDDRARAEILARLRSARPAGRGRPSGGGPDLAGQPGAVPRDYRRTDGDDRDLTALLADRLTDYRATARRCASGDLGRVVAELLAAAPAVVVPAHAPAHWLSAYPGVVLRDTDPRPLTVAELDAPGLAVVTGCSAAVAETGTLILDTSRGQGRRVLTLVPDHHVCIVGAAQIVAGVADALARLADPTRPLTLVSGPSATSDIELDRVEGVHGPRRLDVVIVGDTGESDLVV